jgi:hypothetical protein
LGRKLASEQGTYKIDFSKTFFKNLGGKGGQAAFTTASGLILFCGPPWYASRGEAVDMKRHWIERPIPATVKRCFAPGLAVTYNTPMPSTNPSQPQGNT